MRIALLAHGLHTAGGKSVGVNILAALSRVCPEHTYFAVVPNQADFLAISLPGDSEMLPYTEEGVIKRIRFDLNSLPSRLVSFRPDLIWGLGNMGTVNPPCRQAILLHKSQMVYPSKHKPAEAVRRRVTNNLIRIQLKRSLRFTQLVFCQTEVMRLRFLKSFRFTGKVELMPNAVSSIVTNTVDEAMPNELAANSRPFKLFTLTRYYAHKNLELIIECFDRFRDEMDDVACVLTIAPDQHPRARRLLDAIRAKGLQDAIINVGAISQDRLRSFYRHTNALLLPTLLESFSGTYIESMAFERPIITSDLDFAHEVCGKAALYFNPWSPSSLWHAIRRLKDEKGLADRLIEEGRGQKEKFDCDWDNIVCSAMNAIESHIFNKN